MKNFNLNNDDISKNLNINESIEYNNKKSSISGGIDPERIVNKEYLSSLGDFYKCNICFKIMITPTDCEECGHSYCQECISKLKCPFGCKKKSLKNSSVGIFNLLKNLKFNCPNEGCPAILPYINVKNHDINCEYQKVLCTNKKCKKRVIKKELENHINNICRYTLIKCKYCKTEYYRKEINEHEKLCSLTYQYLKNYNNKDNNNNNINIIESFDINEKNFNKYIQSLSVNISKILKENNNFNNIKSDIKEKNIENKQNIPNENNNNNNQINIDNNKKNKNNDVNKKNNLKNYNDESKQSLAQIEEDDLVDIIKKALDEKLTEKFTNYEINFNDFYYYLKEIKGCVCKLNTIEEVKESEEEDNSMEINNSRSLNKERMPSVNNILDNNSISLELSNKNDEVDNKDKKNNLINIRDSLKDIVNSAENKIKDCIIQLNINILKIKEKEYCKENKKEKNKFEIINQNMEEFSNKIIESIKETKIKISNISERLKKNDNLLNISQNNSDLDNTQNIINIIKDTIQKIFEKNNKEFLNKEIILNNNKSSDIKDDNKNNMNDKKDAGSINNIEENNKLKNEFNISQSEINKNIDFQFQNMNVEEINEVNNELETIKDLIINVKSLLSSKLFILSNEAIYNQKSNIDKSLNKDNLIKEISFQFYNNKTRPFFSEIKSVKTQPKKIKYNYTNNALSSILKIQNLKKSYSAKFNLPVIPTIEEIQNQGRSRSSSSLYFYGSEINFNFREKKDNLILDNDLLEKLLRIELKIKNIYEYMESIPDIVKEKINTDVLQNIFKLKEKVNKNLDEKIKNIFSLKYCEECERVEYFYGFKKCSNCSNDICKNCLSLCPICKKFLCKNCFQKSHQCDKAI